MTKPVRESFVVGLMFAVLAGCGGGGEVQISDDSAVASASPAAPAKPLEVTQPPSSSASVSSRPVAVNLPPVFKSSGAGVAPDNSVDTFYQASALDPEGASVTFAIAGGADAALFSIDARTGQLRFVAPMRFDLPRDADANNVYSVTVSASDGVNKATQETTIAIASGNIKLTL